MVLGFFGLKYQGCVGYASKGFLVPKPSKEEEESNYYTGMLAVSVQFHHLEEGHLVQRKDLKPAVWYLLFGWTFAVGLTGSSLLFSLAQGQ